VSLAEGILLVLGGGAAGFINTLAGGGSAITVPILNEIVGISTANGTNRIAILLADLGALSRFERGKVVPWRAVAPLLLPAVLGAAVGAWAATETSPALMRKLFAVVLLLVAGSVLFRPGRWIEEREASLAEPWRALAFFGIGFYGGFVQAGVGFLLLAGLVLGGGLNLIKGNAAKVVIIGAYTPVALLLFARAAQVDVAVGVVLSVGQVAGAWIAAHMALARGAPWVRWVLVAAAVVAAVRLALT
jgi:uncharacterized membrane protein YfcA